MADLVTGLIGAGTQIYGLLNNMHQQKWLNDFAINQLNNQRAAQERGVQSWNASADPARDSSLALRDNLAALMLGNDGSSAQLSNLLQNYPGLLDQLLGSGADPFARGMNPGMQNALSRQDQSANSLLDSAGIASQVFSGGGWTPGREDSQARFMDMLNGMGAEMGTLSDVGTSLLSGRGQNAYTLGLQDRGMDAINRGGMTDQLQRAWAASGGLLDPQGRTGTLNSLQNSGLGMLQAQGFNPQNSALFNSGLNTMNEGALGTKGLTAAGGAAEAAGLGDILNGGQSPISQALASRGLDLASRESLLPPEVAMLIARENASRDAQGAFRQAQRQALARKGGAAGIVAAGGGEHDPMSEYADQAARAVSDAGRKALLDQQGLQLQQANMGAGMAGQAGGLDNSKYSAASNLVQGLEGNATQRYLGSAGISGNALQNALGYANLGSSNALGGQQQETQRFLGGLQLQPDITNSATGQLNAYGNLGLGAGSLENARMGTGLNSLQAYNQNRLGAGSLMNNSLTDQGQYALGAGNLQNSLTGNYMNAMNSLFGNNLAAGQFGAGLNQAQMNGYNQLFNNTLGYNRDNLTGLQSAIGNLINLGGQGLTYATAGMGQVAAPQYINTQPAFANIAQGLGNINFGGMAGNRNQNYPTAPGVQVGM